MGNSPSGDLSWWGIVVVGNCHGGELVGSCPGGDLS